MLLLSSALLLGMLHAFGPDHLAAVSTFVSHQRRLGAALWVSLRWGVAHLVTVLLLGVGISALAIPFSHRMEPYAEFTVGWVLVFVGLVSLWRGFRSQKLHSHRHRHGSLIHSHLHSHAHGAEHYDKHAVTLTGAVHGLAGTVPALALFPLATLRSPWLIGACLLLFGFGVILGMAFYCLALSRLLRVFPEPHLRRWAQPIIASGSCALGVLWIIRTGLLSL